MKELLPGNESPAKSAAESAGLPQLARKRGLSRTARWLLWSGAVVLAVVAAVGIAADILLHRAAPMLRASLVDTLQKRFHAKVELDNLTVSVLDGFWVEGTGLRIWLPDAEALETDEAWRKEPWIVVGRLKFHASWKILPGKPIDVSVIHADGVRVQLPPKEDRSQMKLTSAPAGQANVESSGPNRGPVSGLFQMPRIRVQKVECEQAQLVLERKAEPGKPAKTPLDFELKRITLIPDGKGGPVHFDVDMVNAKPIGTIHSTGHFGPLVAGDPGELPVDGDYRFDAADLSTIKGIAGILSSTGHYAGTLRRIEVDGETQTPDFRLERIHKAKGVPLSTQFHAIVDGTNGDTQLQPVDATLGRTHFIARGDVLRAEDAGAGEGVHGHDITLDVTMDRGSIDDILAIAADAEKPFMTGNLTLRTKFHLPPNAKGQQKAVFDRLQLDGEFHLSQARFNNATMQGKIEDLSMRGQGKPDEVKTTDPATILSEVEGHFQLANGTLQLPDLVYAVPGARILAHGAYGLQGGTLSFEGDAKLDAEISNVIGGWKGLLLKPMDHYLKKNGAGTDVPIHIQGTRKEPKFGVDFDRLGKTDKSEAPGSR